ncbi:MAG: hypothetical protein U9Q97_04780 [Acidobacteriota bacterium]|nr:hypothetical protein [Acidobacteriota bacterium]
MKTKVLESSNLGPIQIDALYFYLKDMELIINRSETTIFYEKVSYLYQQEGINSENLWSFLWVNLYFNAPLFRWWGSLGLDEYTREMTISLLSDFYGKKNRSITNAYSALIGTFERTPIGSGLKIGKVEKDGRARKIIKEGGYLFNPIVVLYSLYKYAEMSNNYRINMESIRNSSFSPQNIFVLRTEEITQLVLSLFEPEILKIDFNNEKMVFVLNNHKNSLDVLGLHHQ